MPSAQINSLASLEALARPANTITSNLPKQAMGRPQRQGGKPDPFKAGIPRPNRGVGKTSAQTIASFDKGGKVPKTDVYKVHKGERVLNAKQTKKFEKSSMKSVLAGER